MQQLTLFDHEGDKNPFKTKTSNDWKWSLKDLDNVEKIHKTVLSAFSCGGGAQWVIN